MPPESLLTAASYPGMLEVSASMAFASLASFDQEAANEDVSLASSVFNLQSATCASENFAFRISEWNFPSDSRTDTTVSSRKS